jgi:hypothetical protein
MELSPAWELKCPLLVKLTEFYGSRRVITTFTSALHLSLCGARSIQFVLLISPLDPFLILSSLLRLGLPGGLLPSGLLTKMLYAPLLFPLHATCPATFVLTDLITRIIFVAYRS